METPLILLAAYFKKWREFISELSGIWNITKLAKYPFLETKYWQHFSKGATLVLEPKSIFCKLCSVKGFHSDGRYCDRIQSRAI